MTYNIPRRSSDEERHAIHQAYLDRLHDMHWRAMQELIAKYRLKSFPFEVPDPQTGILITFTDSEKFSQWVWKLVCKNHY